MISIGGHRLLNASIDSPALDDLLQGETVRVLYSDPPWGPGNMKYWSTISRKMTGVESPNISFGQLLDRLEHLVARYVDGHVFIEMGERWVDDLLKVMSRTLRNVEVVPTTYRGGKDLYPAALVHGQTAGSTTSVRAKALSGLRDGALSIAAVREVAIKDAIVLDPCCGMGYSARAAIANQMRFVGCELNAARLAKTAHFLTSAIG